MPTGAAQKLAAVQVEFFVHSLVTQNLWTF